MVALSAAVCRGVMPQLGAHVGMGMACASRTLSYILDWIMPSSRTRMTYKESLGIRGVHAASMLLSALA
jgi:hypothetical protein